MPKTKKTRSKSKSNREFAGAATMAQRRAFRAKQPVVILEDGRIYRVYADGTRQEVLVHKRGGESG